MNTLRARIKWDHVRHKLGKINTSFWWGNMKEGDNLKDLGIECDIFKMILNLEYKNWIYLALDKDHRQRIVNSVIKHGV
jgi:hypothetical protein